MSARYRIGPEFYTLDQFHSIALKQRDMNVACGMSKDGVDYLTRSWIDALVQFRGLPEVVAEALRRRLML